MGALNPGPPPPGLGDEALLDHVARATVGYVHDFAHPGSGMVRERSGGQFGYDTARTVTTGGTGFGIMALLSAEARGWIDTATLAARLERLVGFLERADRFDGVFPHFLDGETGRVVPFSRTDDGGDLVETAFLLMGLLAARTRFPGGIGERIDRLWRAVDWTAHVRDADSLMWHAHPDRPHAAKGLTVHGWNEALVVYVLAAGAPEHPIDPRLYERCWCAGAWFENGETRFGVTLPLGPPLGGPLFLSQYSFLGLDPRGLADAHADYAEQTRAHAALNHAYCVANPKCHAGYGPDCWGLSASDSPGGYAAHSPENDLGVVTPTAALSSLPFLPDAAMAALRAFTARPELWGPFGPVDAFHPGSGWIAPHALAIDQAPIAVMIENFRTGLLWELFMAAPEVRSGLSLLGFRQPPVA